MDKQITILEVEEQLHRNGFECGANIHLEVVEVYNVVDADDMWEIAHEASEGASEVVMLSPGRFQIQF